jgi:glycine/D-amino acid oxidase-like deaminating enzyme
MGMSSAYQLCQRGHEVTVIERSTVASSASGKAGRIGIFLLKQD